MKHEEFLKIPSIFIEKCRWRKGRSSITPTFLTRFLFLQRRPVVENVFLLNAKVKQDPIKHQESIVDKRLEILKISFNFYRKKPMKKGLLVNNSYIFEPIVIMSTHLSTAVCPLVKCKSLKGSDKASRVYSRWNMSNSLKFHQFS